jgi:hypothetical protein
VGRGVSRGATSASTCKTVSGRVIHKTISGDNLFKANKDHQKVNEFPKYSKPLLTWWPPARKSDNPLQLPKINISHLKNCTKIPHDIDTQCRQPKMFH